MNIKGIGTNNIINLYNQNKTNRVITKDNISKATDTIEISTLGKSLNDYSYDEIQIDNSAKITEIKNQIENGTYNVDARLTAQSIIDVIKEKKI